MTSWHHHIHRFKQGGSNDGSFTIVGYTDDEQANKKLEWEFEIDSAGGLVHSSPSYIHALYKATKLDECIKEFWTLQEQFKLRFKPDLKHGYTAREDDKHIRFY